MALDIVVEVRDVVALQELDAHDRWARPGDVLRLPLDFAAPLIRARKVVLVDQRTPLTRELPTGRETRSAG